MNTTEMGRHAENAARLLKAMSNSHRLLILCQLYDGERSVGELAASVGLSQSALSQHLARLREDGLVRTRRRARSVLYALASREVTALIGTLAGLYCRTPEGAGPAQADPAANTVAARL